MHISEPHSAVSWRLYS